MRRHGTLGLILVLPDGTRRLVPAAWTDLEPGVSAPTCGHEAIGTVADLLNAGRILAGLARRLGTRPDDGGHPVEESARAAAAGPAGDAAPPALVWDGVPDEDQLAVVVALARLIAQAAVLKEADEHDLTFSPLRKPVA
jgi:hypothetical protein